MKISQSHVNLGGIKFSPVLVEPLGFSQMGKHFTASDEIHHKENLFLCLERELQRY
jgi:hypothetical protein